METLVEGLPGTRTLVLVNYRPEYRATWMQKSYYQQMPLLSLGPDAITELLRDLLGTDASLTGLAERIRERTGGNPFFIEEVVQSLIEAGSLEGSSGGYQLVKPADEVAIPARVQSVLAARIDRLVERDKQVLQTASVIGRTFSEPILKAVAELPDTELVAALSSLKRAELIYEEALYPEAVYAFKHALTQEVAYHSQLTEPRGHVHGTVARTIEELYPDRLNERAALIAHHWEEAGQALEAARWHARAAGWVVRSNQQATRSHLLQVRRLLAPLEDSAEKLGLDLMACGELTMLSVSLGAPADEIEALFAEGKALAERISDPGPRSVLQAGYAAYMGLSGGDVTRYASAAREAVRLAQVADDPVHRLAARAGLATALLNAGNTTESLELLEHIVAERPEDPLAGRAFWSMSPWIVAVLGRFYPLGHLGRLGEADEALRQGIELAREYGDLHLLSLGLSFRVCHGEWGGETAITLAGARQGVEIAERTGAPFPLSVALAYLGDALRLEQRYPEALEAYQKALDLIHTKRVGLMRRPEIVSGQALVDSALGEHGRAIARARSALEESVRGGNRLAENFARLTLARVLLATGNPGVHDQIEETVERAENLCEQTGMCLHLPSLLEVRAALAERRDDPQEAHRRLREAHRLFTEMGATGHAERLAKELEQ